MELESYWQQGMTRPSASAEPLPSRADVVVVGGGLSGLAAARLLAANGTNVLVLDAGDIAFGASSRNTGFVGRYFRHGMQDLIGARGKAKAIRVFTELNVIYDAAEARVRELGIDCDWQPTQRFLPAFNERMLDGLEREYTLRAEVMGDTIEMVRRTEDLPLQSRRYVGGVVLDRQAAIHPGKHVTGLADAARRAGADLRSRVRVSHMRRVGAGHVVETSRGPVRADSVLVATNGYTDGVFPWLRNRLLPIRAYHILTATLSDEQLNAVYRRRMLCNDTRQFSNSMRLTPDHRRMIFLGRTGTLRENNLPRLAAELKAQLAAFFPVLKDVAVDRVWTGRCAATFDLYPRTGVHDGIHFAAGMCFSGNAMAPYLGERAARRILEMTQPPSVFEHNEAPRPPLYNGRPWFMPLFGAYHRWRERPVGWNEPIG